MDRSADPVSHAVRCLKDPALRSEILRRLNEDDFSKLSKELAALMASIRKRLKSERNQRKRQRKLAKTQFWSHVQTCQTCIDSIVTMMNGNSTALADFLAASNGARSRWAGMVPQPKDVVTECLVGQGLVLQAK